MLIAEALFLLLRRDDGKPENASAQRGYGLAAAIITDLVLAERITLSDDKDPRVSVLRAGAESHPALDAAMGRLEQREGKKLSSLVTDRRLAVEKEVAALLAILQGLGVAPKVLKDERGTLGRRDLKRRIAEVSVGVEAGDAVARAVAALNTAIMTAAIVPAIAADGSSG